MMRSATILLLVAQALAKDAAENHITDTQAFADQFVSKFIDKLNDRLTNPDKKPEPEPAKKDADDSSEFSDEFVDKLFSKLTQRLHEKLAMHAAASDDTTLDQYSGQYGQLGDHANAFAPSAYGAQYDDSADYEQVLAEAAEAATQAAAAAKMAARAAQAAADAAEQAQYADEQPGQQQPGYDLAEEEPETNYIVSIPVACLLGALAGTITFFLTNKKRAPTEHEELLLA